MQQLYEFLPRTIPLFGGGGLSLYWTLIAVGLMIAAFIINKEAHRYFDRTRHEKLVKRVVPEGGFFGMVSSYIGAKLFYIVFYGWEQFLQNPLETVFSASGWMYYGGEIVGMTIVILYLRRMQFPVLRSLDAVGFGFLIAHGVGRLGCFAGGCCYGIATSSDLGVEFAGMTGPVHPTQLYEAIPLFVAFIILWVIRKRFQTPGRLYAVYFIFYGLLRFFVEIVRASAYPMGPLQLSASQHIAIIQFLLGGALFYWLPKYHRQSFSVRDEKSADYSNVS